MRRICVVYLARALNGIAPFEQFLRSYHHFPAGIDHEFLIVFKGFKQEADVKIYMDLAAKLQPRPFFIDDQGFDIRAYFAAARNFESPYFLFFNSFSEILAQNWLDRMFSVIQEPKVGLVGATASCESMYTNVLIEQSRRRQQPLLRQIWNPIRLKLCQACFDPFPNYHLRTNAILLSREVLLGAWPRRVFTKRGAYLFENGKNSLTKRICRMGLEPVVVGREGVYEKENWAQSRTFRSGNQENLLVADNQTREYEKANSETRRHLARVAWGDEAEVGDLRG